MRVLWLILFQLILLPTICCGKTIELGFPELAHRVKVTLPDAYDSTKKYPAVFYYHAMGREPDTSLIRSHLDGREWMVVGMTYYKRGELIDSAQAAQKELTLLRSVRRHLAEKRGLDQRRCYVAGFSKGGWMVDLLLQSEPSLAGGVILGAGHTPKVTGGKRVTSPSMSNKPVFVGVGRLDGSYPFALRALLHYRSLGARITMETWYGLAHAYPQEGSTALQQWFSSCIHEPNQLRPVALKEMQAEVKDAMQLAPYARWLRLRRLSEYPYSYLLGDTWRKSLKAKIATMEAADPVKMEAAFLKRHRKLLFQEINAHSVLNMAKVNIGYQNLIQKAPKTKQADLARHDHKRTQQLYLQFKEQDAKMENSGDGKGGRKDPFAPLEPKMPENKRYIPRNPLIK